MLLPRALVDFRNTKFHVQPNGEAIQKTISIGVAKLGPSSDAKALIANADNVMYEAKKHGGNRIYRHRTREG